MLPKNKINKYQMFRCPGHILVILLLPTMGSGFLMLFPDKCQGEGLC